MSLETVLSEDLADMPLLAEWQAALLKQIASGVSRATAVDSMVTVATAAAMHLHGPAEAARQLLVVVECLRTAADAQVH